MFMQKQITYLLSLFLVAGLTLSACDTDTQSGVTVSPTDTSVTAPVVPITDTSVTNILTDTAPTEAVTSTDTVTASQSMTATSAITATENVTDSTAATSTTGSGPLLLAYTLMGQSFVNNDGAVSGDINDLIVNLRTGNVLFAQIKYGGFLTIGDTELLVPLRALRWRSVEQDMILNFDEQLLENYPDLTEGSPRLDDPTWYDGITAFWNELGFGSDANTVSTIDPTTDVIVRASDLFGYSLVDFGAGIGTIQNLLIDLGDSRARYLLIGFSPTPADDDAYLIPFSAVDVVNVETNEITMNSDLSLETLQAAPRFDRSLFQGQIGALDPTYDDQADSFWEEQGFAVAQ